MVLKKNFFGKRSFLLSALFVLLLGTAFAVEVVLPVEPRGGPPTDLAIKFVAGSKFKGSEDISLKFFVPNTDDETLTAPEEAANELEIMIYPEFKKAGETDFSGPKSAAGVLNAIGFATEPEWEFNGTKDSGGFYSILFPGTDWRTHLGDSGVGRFVVKAKIDGEEKMAYSGEFSAEPVSACAECDTVLKCLACIDKEAFVGNVFQLI